MSVERRWVVYAQQAPSALVPLVPGPWRDLATMSDLAIESDLDTISDFDGRAEWKYSPLSKGHGGDHADQSLVAG